ncbi:MAG: hypothetical protein CM1200mP29_00120 [Verrucomicrobiota bacterium]|nr:MAG: hypothetical protein CM1200mP29_00120 [Verrucomicrobiota bacterium]
MKKNATQPKVSSSVRINGLFSLLKVGLRGECSAIPRQVNPKHQAESLGQVQVAVARLARFKPTLTNHNL